MDKHQTYFFLHSTQPETNIQGELEQKVLLSVHFSDTVNSRLAALQLIRNLQLGPIYIYEQMEAPKCLNICKIILGHLVNPTYRGMLPFELCCILSIMSYFTHFL